MRKRLRERLDKIETIPALIKDAVMEAKTDPELVDVLGTIKAVERTYKPTVKAAIDETAPAAGMAMRGELHHVETKRSASRSYNTPRLMTKLQAEGFTLMDLIDLGVLSLKWNWQPLAAFAKKRGIKLVIVQKEVPELGKADGDVGEIWKDGYPRWS
jgi:hypothetical protein